jgi:hypothetical protein
MQMIRYVSNSNRKVNKTHTGKHNNLIINMFYRAVHVSKLEIYGNTNTKCCLNQLLRFSGKDI